jgi:asparagine synthase (glutamine-hydrolysing)
VSCHRFLIAWHGALDGRRKSRWGQHCLAAGFVQASVRHDLEVWTNKEVPVLELPGGRGCVIGSLFRKDEKAGTVTSLTPRQAEEILSSQGRALIANFWGSYLAILCPPGEAVPILLRDPSGLMPCYMLPVDSGMVFASDSDLLFESGCLEPSVDWPEVHVHLQRTELRRKKTCLHGLLELAQGHAMAADGRQPQRVLWTPHDHIEPHDSDGSIMARKLEAAIIASAGAMSRPFGHILVGASGGLDSSIVCAALAEQRRRFSCFTMATDDPSGDERRYVRRLSSALGAPCLEYVYDAAQVDPKRSSASHLPRPVGHFFMQQIEQCYRDAWSRTAADAIFTGNGGDNIFSFLHSASPVVDRVLREGIGRGSLQTMIDMCRITRCSVWTMLGGVLSGLRRQKQPYDWAADSRFLTPSGQMHSTSAALTPWLEAAEGLLPGKRAHIATLMRTQNMIEGYDRRSSLPVIPVLLCQPVVELCLSIPSWRWCEGGVNRSMARVAFENRLPPSIVNRVSKAGPESLSAEFFEQAAPILREQLLEGLLAQHGVIDRKAVEEALARTATRRGQLFHRLLALAEAEAWSRHWHLRQAG